MVPGHRQQDVGCHGDHKGKLQNPEKYWTSRIGRIERTVWEISAGKNAGCFRAGKFEELQLKFELIDSGWLLLL